MVKSKLFNLTVTPAVGGGTGYAIYEATKSEEVKKVLTSDERLASYLRTATNKTPSFKSNTIGFKLLSEGFTIAVSGDFHSLANRYALKKEKNEEALSFVDYSNNSELVGALEKKCEEVLKGNYESETYKNSKRWCTKPFSLIVEFTGFPGLFNISSPIYKKAESVLNSKKEEVKKALSLEDSTMDNLVSKCTSLLTGTSSYDKDFDLNKELVKKYCIIS